MKARLKLSEDRILQILNNVSEEYVDLRETSFATKAELCESIIWLQNKSTEYHNRVNALAGDATSFAIKVMEFRLELTTPKQGDL